MATKGFSGSSFVVGFIPGIFLGLFIAAVVAYYISRRAKNEKDSWSIFGGRTPTRQNISEPIYMPQLGARTDFLGHKRTTSANSMPSKAPPLANLPPTYAPHYRPDTASTFVEGQSPPRGKDRSSPLRQPTPDRGTYASTLADVYLDSSPPASSGRAWRAEEDERNFF